MAFLSKKIIKKMAEKYTLATKSRENTKNSARETRADGSIPAVVYGHGIESTPISVDYSEFLKLFRKTGQAALIDLDVNGKSVKVLVHTYDRHPVREEFQHIDFFAVNPKETTMVHVPLIFEGESEAVKTLGGVFVSSHEELLIRCLPSDIPHDLIVDISVLEDLSSSITIADLNLSSELEVMHLEPKTMICSISGRMTEEEAITNEEGAEVAESDEETKEETEK